MFRPVARRRSTARPSRAEVMLALDGARHGVQDGTEDGTG